MKLTLHKLHSSINISTQEQARCIVIASQGMNRTDADSYLLSAHPNIWNRRNESCKETELPNEGTGQMRIVQENSQERKGRNHIREREREHTVT